MTSDVNIRELILGVLLMVTRDGEYSHIALKATLDKYQYLSKQERSFITRVCEGTLEHMIWIDYVINTFSKVKVNKMKPVIRTILRSAVYELKYMDAVPVSATCNEAVKLAQKKGFHNLKGFVNGVLRTISRELEQVELPDKEENLQTYLSVRYSMPEWIVALWLEQYSKEQVERMLSAFLEEPKTSIRVNTARIERQELMARLKEEGVSVVENEALSEGLFIWDYDYLEALESFREGLFYIQDVSSMMVGHWANPKAGDYVIDMCAAPGGKSIHLAEMLKGTGMVEARDLTPYKVGLIQENIERSQLQNIRAKQADARELAEGDVAKADLVIADLPCSGLGVIAKKKDIKYKMTTEKQMELVKLQREILDVAAEYVKPGGILMYSTCTIHAKENEENVLYFLKQHPGFALEKQEQILPKAGVQDGFFIARLKKESHG